jgi:hypothetical protein
MKYLKYFAYGSNMLTERLRRRVPSTKPIGPARLDGFELRFHKRGADGSAKCDVVAGGDGSVHGVLFKICAEERYLLDRGWADQPIPRERLYDLALDPGEKHDLSASPAHAATLDAMRDRLETWMEETADPLRLGFLEPPLGAVVNDPNGASPGEWAWQRVEKR